MDKEKTFKQLLASAKKRARAMEHLGKSAHEILKMFPDSSAHWHTEDHFFTYLKWSLDNMRDMAQSISKKSIMETGVKQVQAGKKQKKMKKQMLDNKMIKATLELYITVIESKGVLFSKFFKSQNNCKKVPLIANKLMT
eukprot:m51a1_g7129 hypothetical protein (139) ;mRNA; r:227775-234328